jgi:hypothetical protein
VISSGIAGKSPMDAEVIDDPNPLQAVIGLLFEA